MNSVAPGKGSPVLAPITPYLALFLTIQPLVMCRLCTEEPIVPGLIPDNRDICLVINHW